MHLRKFCQRKRCLFIDKQYNNTDLYFIYVGHLLCIYDIGTMFKSLYAKIHFYYFTLFYFEIIFFMFAS